MNSSPECVDAATKASRDAAAARPAQVKRFSR
jgi:hypothetical protein